MAERRLLLAALVALLAALPARAETPEVIQRLMAEPLTLLDWGLAQLDRDLGRAAARLLPERPAQPRYRTSATYNWRDGRILMALSVVAKPDARTAAGCRGLFHSVVDDLTATAPRGRYAAGWYLADVFRPQAHRWTSRYEDIGARLLEVVRLEVQLRAAPYDVLSGDKLKVRCSGRLDAGDANILVEQMS